ncbi:MAG TPA: PAS domain S-box protein [Baekduia sp.]
MSVREHHQEPAPAGAAAAEEAYAPLLRALAERLEARLVAAWEADPGAGDTLVCVACWHAPGAELRALAGVTRTTVLRAGEALPGQVFASGQAAWPAEAAGDDRAQRSAAAAAGLHGAAALPVTSERGTVGVVELLAERPFAEPAAAIDLLGLALGQLVERRRAERAGHAALQRHRATLHAALDSVVTMDHEGRVVELNPAAERTFGHASADVVGRDMADLIVPPELREPHREGLRRYLADGASQLLDRRIATEALRADGSRFPVELTITRIALPGPALFTGHLRDVSDRMRATAELRASRARIVEGADEARRRIERDLHDGAQQQLVSLALDLRLALRRLDAGDAAAARELIVEADGALTTALAELRELARGIHPAVLTEGGLRPALRGLVGRSPVPATVVAVPERRLPASIEAAVYFFVAEGLTNAARHAGDVQIQVEVIDADALGRLVVEVRDDGDGGADPAGGGLRGLIDRLAVIGGTLTVISPPGGGTTLRGEIPCGS